MAKRNTAQSPLTPAVLHILLALSTGERHGYGIMKQVEADSQGKVKMGPGTLYGSIARMTEAGLVRECDKRVDPQIDDERRIYYELTSEGQAALEEALQPFLAPAPRSPAVSASCPAEAIRCLAPRPPESPHAWPGRRGVRPVAVAEATAPSWPASGASSTR